MILLIDRETVYFESVFIVTDYFDGGSCVDFSTYHGKVVVSIVAIVLEVRTITDPIYDVTVIEINVFGTC